MITINLSRKKGSINIPVERPTQLPENVVANISNLTVPSLKQICDAWNIQRRGLTRAADIQNALRNGFTTNTNKKDKGQYNTTNATYIFDGFVPLEKYKKVVDPCAGDGDLIAYICQFGDAEKIMFDIDPSKVCCQTRNTLIEPIDYTNMMLVMNPPYLSNVQNKDIDNTIIYEKYGLDDLYKCYIKTMCATPPPEFMIIIPLNFLCSVRSADRKLREQFFTTFEVVRINIFNEQVFEDTSYSVCAIHGIKNKETCLFSMPAHIYPSGEKIQLDFSPNFLIGGEIYDLPESTTYTVGRALTGSKNVSNLFLKAIDDSHLINLCVAQHPADGSFGKVSDRSYAWLIVEPAIDENKQKYVANKFNRLMCDWRKKYHSLFLTNYRENGRKRISFGLAFRIVGYILGLDEVDDIPDVFTKEIRNEYIGTNTRENICEKWQIEKLRAVGVPSVAGTNVRVNSITFEIETVATGLFDRLDFADWSEDFDLIMKVNDATTLYFNLKFICESGGSQNRSIKPLANMIYYLAKHIEKKQCRDKKFIFIMDGEYLTKFIVANETNGVSQFHYQIDRVDPTYKKYFFIGSTKQFLKNSVANMAI